MPIMLFPRCLRNREDCEPFDAIDAAPEDVTDEQVATVDYEPISFVCCGLINEGARGIQQDAYRVCWKNAVVDEMGDYDEQDLTHMQCVVSKALAMVATRRVNSGAIEVPTMQATGV